MQLKKFDEAYHEYQEAKRLLPNPNPQQPALTRFIIQLQLLQVLQHSLIGRTDVSRAEESNTIIREISKEYPDSFAYLYWMVVEKIGILIRSKKPWDETNRALAKSFMQAEGLFLLREYAEGYGAFLEVWGTFFQGALWVYCDLTNPGMLDEQVKQKWVEALLPTGSNTDDTLADLAAKKFERVVYLLADFQRHYVALVRKEPVITQSIRFIKDFLVHFYLLSNKQFTTRYTPDQIANIVQVDVAIVRTINTALMAPIAFLTRLEQEFDIRITSLEAFLEQLSRSLDFAKQQSPTTGNTMLHHLMQFPAAPALSAEVQACARRLQPYATERNREDETPLMLLPFQLALSSS